MAATKEEEAAFVENVELLRAYGKKPIDRTGWGRGPWDYESDVYAWTTRAGLTGVILRSDMGALCGYVDIVDPLHPAWGVPYDDIDVEVHGGLTYSGEPRHGVWRVGFDCAHYHDKLPSIGSFQTIEPTAYRDAGYVRVEVERLAKQLAEWGRPR